MMIRAKTPIAANIAPMMILVEFGSLVVAFGGVVKVNWPTRAHQHACGKDRKGSNSQYRHQIQSLY